VAAFDKLGAGAVGRNKESALGIGGGDLGREGGREGGGGWVCVLVFVGRDEESALGVGRCDLGRKGGKKKGREGMRNERGGNQGKEGGRKGLLTWKRPCSAKYMSVPIVTARRRARKPAAITAG